MEKLNINQAVFRKSSGKHQFSVKDFVLEELFPHQFQFLTFVKSNKITHCNSFLLFDFFDLLIVIYKTRTHFFLNQINMGLFGKRQQIFCPIPIKILLIFVFLSFWFSGSFNMFVRFLDFFLFLDSGIFNVLVFILDLFFLLLVFQFYSRIKGIFSHLLNLDQILKLGDKRVWR